jgi:hypothetical protein
MPTTNIDLESDLNAVFMAPLAEFVSVRNALAKRLKDAGRAADAERVKALSKPPITAWAVNQLYWKHRDAFDRLLTAGERLGQAHTSLLAGKASDLRGLMAARNEAISVLSQLASSLLHDAGHSPTPDALRRITTSLEALSAQSSAPDAPHPGRLTEDVGPLGFDSLAALAPAGGPARAAPKTKASEATPRQTNRESETGAAKSELESAEQVLRDLRSHSTAVAQALQKAASIARESENERRRAEEDFVKARTAEDEAKQRVHELNEEAAKTREAIQDAERAIKKAREALR